MQIDNLQKVDCRCGARDPKYQPKKKCLNQMRALPV
jgi:hypothetical protein